MYSAIITAISNMFAKFFEFKATSIENQAQNDLIEDKKDYKKATDIAEKIIEIAQNYKSEMTFSHRLKFGHLVNSFRKYN